MNRCRGAQVSPWPGFARACAVLGLLIATGTGCFEAQDPGPEPERREAPTFSLTRLDGLPVDLSALRGRTVILDFWATWCAPCEVQMPVLEALWKDRGGDDLMILGLSVDSDPAEKVIAWLAKRELDYPIAIVEQDLALEYRVIGFPTLYIIDPNGRIHTQHTGVLSRPELEDLIDEIARETPPGPPEPASLPSGPAPSAATAG